MYVVGGSFFDIPEILLCLGILLAGKMIVVLLFCNPVDECKQNTVKHL